jgi:Na+/proline symporter
MQISLIFESYIDHVIVISYLILISVVGYFTIKEKGGIKSYVIGNNAYPTAVIIATFFATDVESGQVMGVPANVYKNGVVFGLTFAIGITINYIIVALAISKKYNQFNGIISVAEFIGKAYGKNAQIISGIVGLFMCVGVLAAQVKAMTFIFQSLGGGNSQYYAILASVTPRAIWH